MVVIWIDMLTFLKRVRTSRISRLLRRDREIIMWSMARRSGSPMVSGLTTVLLLSALEAVVEEVSACSLFH